MPTQLNYVDRDVVVADAKNESEIAKLVERFIEAQAHLEKAKADLEDWSTANLAVIRKGLSGTDSKE